MDLALNNLKWLICHKTKLNQTKPNLFATFLSVTFNEFIIIIIILFLVSFSHKYYLVVFHWSLTDSNSSQVTRTLLGILANLNNAVVWMVLILLQISNFSYRSSKPFVTIPSTPITTGITVMFQSFFSSLANFKHLSISLFPLI